MKRLIYAVVVFIISFAVGVVAGQFVHIHIGLGEEETVNVQILQEQIRDISELVTIEDTVPVNCTVETNLVKSDNDIVKFFTAKTVTATASVAVKLGTDLDAAEFDLNDDATKLRLTVPHCSISSLEIDEDNWQVESKSGVFNWVKMADNDKVRKQVKKQAEKHINNGNLLERADANVANQLTKILETANPGLEVTVEFR